MKESKLKALIHKNGDALDTIETEVDDGALALAALACCESTFGRNNQPRIEKSYLPGGYYWSRALHVRRLYQRFGKAAAASWGPWQILFVTAWELGYRGNPQDLASPEVSLPWVIKYLNDRVLCWGGVTLEELADAYNSGSFMDSYEPKSYIHKFLQAYEHEAREWLYD